MKNNKKLIVAAVAVLVLVAVFVGVFLATRPETAEGAKTITVTVVHSDGTEKAFTYHTDEEFLGAVLLSEGLIQGSDSEYGLMVTSVDGETADYNVDQSYWALYVGEEYGMLGADQQPIKDGDSFKWVYTVG